MALTLAYSVTGIKVKDEVNADGDTLENAVCQTYWKATGTDAAGNVGEFSGATPFTAASVPAADFTDLADLTEANVIGWITAVVDADADYAAHIEAQCQKQIDLAAMSEPALPWAPADDGVTPVPDELP